MKTSTSKSSKYWEKMFISSNISNTDQGFIISKEKPVDYDERKVNLSVGIKESEYSELSEFYEKYNRMSTGNTTLLPTSELKRHLSLDNTSVLLRSPKGPLMGTIISLELPIKCKEQEREEIIIHGCTSYLCVHPSIRNHGMCMALIRGLIEAGFKKNYYCDYHMVSFKIGKNSIPLNSWYRPIRLNRARQLGFTIPSLSDRRLRLKYNNRLPPNTRYQETDNDGLRFYRDQVKNKKFVFWPDENMWSKWTKSFPTYNIYHNNVIVGVVSVNTLYCRIESTKETGKLIIPVICVGNINITLSALNCIAYDNEYDVVYYYQHGNLTDEELEKVNAMNTDTPTWFSLYNNRIQLNPDDLVTPLL